MTQSVPLKESFSLSFSFWGLHSGALVSSQLLCDNRIFAALPSVCNDTTLTFVQVAITHLRVRIEFGQPFLFMATNTSLHQKTRRLSRD